MYKLKFKREYSVLPAFMVYFGNLRLQIIKCQGD